MATTNRLLATPVIATAFDAAPNGDTCALGAIGADRRRVTITHSSLYRKRPTVERLLTADEVAERLGMKTEWVWAQARAGLIPHVLASAAYPTLP